MKRIPFGRTGRSVPVIGLGCAGMSHSYGPADEQESLATLHGALDLGIELFDTADAYGAGHNEELIGRFVREAGRSRVLLATKFGLVKHASGERSIDNSPAYVAQACDASLQRLGVDTIDLLYMHRRDPGVPLADSVGAMARLVECGKVRWLGLSEVSAATLREASSIAPISALQSEYSLWTRDPEGDVLDTCRDLGITFVPFGPLGRAFLTGAVQPGSLAPGDFRARLPRFQGEAADRNRDLVDRLSAFAQRFGATPAQIALAWLVAKNDGTRTVMPIPGTKRRKYLAENIAATAIHLSEDQIGELDRMFAPEAIGGARYAPADAAQVGT